MSHPNVWSLWSANDFDSAKHGFFVAGSPRRQMQRAPHQAPLQAIARRHTALPSRADACPRDSPSRAHSPVWSLPLTGSVGGRNAAAFQIVPEADREHFQMAPVDPEAPGLLRVHMQHAVGLRAADLNGKSDPYAIITSGGVSRRTAVCPATLAPIWNELIELPGKLSEFVAEGLHISIKDKDTFTKDDDLGARRCARRLASRHVHVYAEIRMPACLRRPWAGCSLTCTCSCPCICAGELRVGLDALCQGGHQAFNERLPTQGTVHLSVEWVVDAPQPLTSTVRALAPVVPLLHTSRVACMRRLTCAWCFVRHARRRTANCWPRRGCQLKPQRAWACCACT